MEEGVNTRQLFIGLCILLLGGIFYYLFRSAEHTYFLKFLGNTPYLKDFQSPLILKLGNSLPTFIHVFAFTLMTAGFVASKKRDYIIICLFWFVIDVFFELAQGLGNIIILIIPDWFSNFLFLENTRSYFLHGQLDYLDIVSIALGSLVAYIILINTSEYKGGAS